MPVHDQDPTVGSHPAPAPGPIDAASAAAAGFAPPSPAGAAHAVPPAGPAHAVPPPTAPGPAGAAHAAPPNGPAHAAPPPPGPAGAGDGTTDPSLAEALGVEPDGPHVVRTDADAVDGLVKCERCGATEIALNPATGMLRCAYCRHEWQTASVMEDTRIGGAVGDLTGVVMGSGSADIIPSTDEVLTFKCGGCGAEVVIDTAHSTQARCHWCRQTLSNNQQMPNGAVPDMILPFRLTRDQAIERISEFVGKRKSFAHPRFKREFNPENVMGVYLPYMVVDINAKVALSGQGEHQTRSYTVKQGDKQVRVYDADVYQVTRTFDLHVDDLTVESSQDRLDQVSLRNANNIINSILPFDTENAVRYDSNYLSGYTSERRDTNVDQLWPIAHQQAQDIARHQANSTLGFYDRGVRWDHEHLEATGQRWVSAYLPVWLYSYHQKRSNGSSFLHYVAVNARTGETMGSIPLNQGKLLAVSAAVQVVGTIACLVVLVTG